jgi:hypothetical protein
MTFKGTLLPYQPVAVERMMVRKKMLVAYDLRSYPTQGRRQQASFF